MARLAWTESAVAQLERLVLTHSLPANTRERTEASVGLLAQFPQLGCEIGERGGTTLSFVLGPWPWMVLVYTYLEGDDLALVVAVEDGRSARSSITGRP
jgi:plasmid stabilization system protein ParE